MKIVDEKLLDEFRAPQPCSWCRIRVATDPHHIFAKGMGGGGRLDVRINLASLCRACHTNAHDGHQPRTADLLQIVARRERTTAEAIVAEIHRLRRFGKGSLANMGIISEQALRGLPGFDASFHLGEKPAAAPEPPPVPADDCDEVKEFMPAVIALAESLGWEVWHCRNAKFSKAGFLDLELCRPPRLLKIELKSAKGTLTPAQKKWLNLYRKCPGIEAFVFWPKDWTEIERVLSGKSLEADRHRNESGHAES